MKNRLNPSPCLIAVVAAVLAFGQAWLVAQAPDASAAPKRWDVARTPHGHPDLQGYWTSLSFTPFERPEKFGTREFLTDQELDELFKAGVQRSYELTFANPADTPVYDATVYALDAWQNGVRPNRRTSLVVDPPDGRLPPLTPEAQARRRSARPAPETFNGPEDLGMGVRCFTFGGPPIPAGSNYNQNTFIVQGKDHIVFEYEWGSVTRVVPLDGRPHLSARIRPWRGDSRGRWDGDTLVIDTTNFRPGVAPQNSNAAMARLTERFTRIDEATIEYTYIVNDPSTWTRPWTAIIPLSKVEGPLFEYACHEGNNGLVNILEGARAQEKQGAGRRQ
ncbi:MAG: hypothetical protein HYY76_17910 [Acidobacteria bacterium]|nr:hypothetical protein [Acidobacteriota bacterium]